jgi:hypothetical protein
LEQKAHHARNCGVCRVESFRVKPVAIVGLLGLYGVIQFMMRPFANRLENLFDLVATAVITLTFAETVWMGEEERNIGLPGGFYVVFVVNILFVVGLVLAVCWPVLMAVRDCARKRRHQPILHEMQVDSSARQKLADEISRLSLDDLSDREVEALLAAFSSLTRK